MGELFIYPQLPTTEKLPLNLNGMGLNHVQERLIRPNGVPFYQWIQCLKGKGFLYLGNTIYIVEKGWGIFLPPDTPHQYWSEDNLWEVNFLGFSGKLADFFLKEGKISEAGIYHPENPEEIIRLENEIYRLYLENSALKDEEISMLLYGIVLQMMSMDSSSIGNSAMHENLKLRNVISFMEDNYSKDISLNDIAEHAGLSKEYLCSKFKKNMEKTIVEYLTEIRLIHARIFLMQFPEKKVYEIAKMCGFEDSSYFCSVFKKSTGLSPKEYQVQNH